MTILTVLHVLISLAGIFTGFVVVFGMTGGKALPCWTTVFLWTTAATSLTGFMFPVHHFMPSHAVGIVSLFVLTFTLIARYPFGLRGGWRTTYAVTAVIALYLNVFVLVAQLFLKVPDLHALAPNGNEPPFAVAQGAVLVAFVALGVVAVRKFKAAA